MALGVDSADDSSQGRLQGALSLLNVLIGIRVRGVTDPESRRHLIWLNDIVAALGLWNRRAQAGRRIDFADYLESAVAFWSRVARDCRISVDRPSTHVEVSDVTSAALSIITHELLGAAVARAQPGNGDCMISLALEADADTLKLSVIDHGPASNGELSSESQELVRGLAQHLGGRFDLELAPLRSATVILPVHPRPGPRH